MSLSGGFSSQSKDTIKWTKSNRFNMVLGAVITFNAIILGLEADYGHSYGDFFGVLEHVFCAVFTLELLLHFAVEGARDYFSDRMNWLDFLLVVCAVVDAWIIRTLGVNADLKL